MNMLGQPRPVLGEVTPYNAAFDLLSRNLSTPGRAAKTAFIDDYGRYSYGELAERVRCFAGALQSAGIQPEQRVLLCLNDSIDFPTAFLGSLWAGVVPVPVNTMLNHEDYAYMLRHSHAQAVFVSRELAPQFDRMLGELPDVSRLIISDRSGPSSFDAFVAGGAAATEVAATTSDEIAFWLYSSGSTGRPKGVVHTHASLFWTAELYGKPVMGVREDDVLFSAAKLFFAYGLGNSLTFPMSVGATSVLMEEPPKPAAIFKRLIELQPTVFCVAATGYAAMLASPELPPREAVRLRICTSAGEALPETIGRRFTEHFGCEILDGLGSTEMLHIFLSNHEGSVRYGSTGRPVQGYEVELRDESGRPVADGEVGDLYIKGPSSAVMYWANRDKTCQTFQGAWTKSGDKYVRDAEGYYTYCGRSDDMLKVSGIYVSPIEVEAALISHPEVLEAAVVGARDKDGLLKPKAYVVLREPVQGAALDALCETLKAHVRACLAPYKYPRWIEVLHELPKTATGKVQRYKLR